MADEPQNREQREQAYRAKEYEQIDAYLVQFSDARQLGDLLQDIKKGIHPKLEDAARIVGKFLSGEGKILPRNDETSLDIPERGRDVFITGRLEFGSLSERNRSFSGVKALQIVLGVCQKIDSQIDETDARKQVMDTIQGALHGKLAELECAKPKEERSPTVSSPWLDKACAVLPINGTPAPGAIKPPGGNP